MISSYLRNNVLGLVAIFLALGGVGYAAGLRRNSVRSRTIKDGQVLTQDIGTGAVGTDDLAANAVDGSRVKDESLTGADVNEGTLRIPASAVDTSALQLRVSGNCSAGESIRAIAADGTVTCQGAGGPPSGAAGGDLAGTYPNPDIGFGTVGSSEVATDSLTASDLGTGSVGTSEVATDALGSADLGADSVGSSEIATDAVGTAEVGTNALGSGDIDESTLFNDDSLAANDIATGAVGSAEVAADSLANTDLATDSVQSPEIQSAAVGSAEIGTGAVGTQEIASDSVTRQDIAPQGVGETELDTVFVQRSGIDISGGASDSLSVVCPAGSSAIGGGAGGGVLANRGRILVSEPTDGTPSTLNTGDVMTGWRAGFENTDPFSSIHVFVYALCLT